MSLSSVLLITIMATFTFSALLLYWGAKRDNQFEDIEGIKYRMLEDE